MGDNFLDFGNMLKALKKSCNNVRWKTSVASFEFHALKNTIKSITELKTGKYKISEYSEFTITEPKRRNIMATKIKDRQIQRSLCDNYLYDAITKSFIYDNCACQIGKGNDFALKRMKTHLQKQFRKSEGNNFYYLKCDIHHFFESIDHNILKNFISKQVRKEFELDLTFQVIDSFGDKGLGLGSQLSQLLALLYLNEMDHIIKEKFHIKRYIGYMDDFILIHESKEKLIECRDFIVSYLNSIGLKLNKKTALQPIKKGLLFLNWQYKITETGKILMIQNRKSLTRKRRKVRKMVKMLKNGGMSKKDFNQSVCGIINNLSKGNSYNVICGLKKGFIKYI